MKSQQNNIYVFLGIIIVFVITKITHLGVGFFWDESWVYAPAVKSMAEGMPSLLPNAIPVDYSRGHPLLFHFLGGLWIKVFGDSNTAMHAFPLLISIIYLTYAYKLLTHLGIKHFYLILVLFIIQPIFYAQSSMVLPEVLLGATALASIYYYLKRQLLLYIICACLGILTKESGIIIIGAITLHYIITALIKKERINRILAHTFLLLSPIVVLIIHMALCKYYFDWYLYPLHTDLVQLDIKAIIKSFTQIIYDQALDQYRFLFSIPILLAIYFQLFTSDNKNYKFVTTLSLIFSLSTFFILGLKNALGFSFYLGIFIYLVIMFLERKKNWSFLVLAFLFISLFGLFSAVNFYSVRYLLSSLFLVFVIPFAIIEGISIKLQKYLIWLWIATSLCYGIFLFIPKKANDINLTYINYSSVMSKTIKYFEENSLYDKHINTLFLTSVALDNIKAGYRSTDTKFKEINTGEDKAEQYYIFDAIEHNPKRDEIKDSEYATLISRFEKGNFWTEIWRISE